MKQDYNRLTRWLIFRHFRFWAWNKTPYDSVTNEVDEIPVQNIYGHVGSSKEYAAKQKKIHYRFKYNFFVPLLWLAKTVLGKALEKGVPDKLEYKNLRLFEHAYLRTIDEWNSMYRAYQGVTKVFIRPPRGRIEHLKSQICNYFLKTMMQVYVTIVKNDTSYLEFHNMLMYNLTLDMNKNHKGSVPHLFYQGRTINEVIYFIALPIVNGIDLKSIGKGNGVELQSADNKRKS